MKIIISPAKRMKIDTDTLAYESQIFGESKQILNLASVEYSRSISRYLDQDVRYVTCVFGELIKDMVIEKGSFAKMARGEMVRFMAEQGIKDMEEIKQFNHLNYTFAKELSCKDTYVFLRDNVVK